MNWKYYLIIIIVFIVSILLFLAIALSENEKLNKEIPNINSLNDVKQFIVKCNNKLFLDCDELLKRKIEIGDSEK